MCGGGGGYSAPPTPKVDPAPTAVVDSGKNSAQSTAKKERRKKGQSSNVLAADRDTILGNVGGTSGTNRTTLG